MKIQVKIASLIVMAVMSTAMYGVKVDLYNYTRHYVTADVSFVCANGGSHTLYCPPANVDINGNVIGTAINDHVHWDGCNHDGMYVYLPNIKDRNGKPLELKHTNFTVDDNVWYEVRESCGYPDWQGKEWYNCDIYLVYSKGGGHTVISFNPFVSGRSSEGSGTVATINVQSYSISQEVNPSK
jgi:hypothetical protein